ncbi:hypothetical protein ANCCEY_08526 [Ancylostoma ceylanicum]|uniref:Uncharacterized protein n=1 Tax=Ancylostoma ceylanicum TaxID=53326 RepID=A0A0D6LMF7_9BILA|nr:hypothetical protein ANCCEY_08526 [Ancylostoma ceylanicum]
MALKWAAIMTGQSTDYLGTKEKIEEGGKFKAASVFYATPPTATMEEALEDFLAAYEEKPDWIENLIYIARIYLAKGDKVENAKNFFSKVIALTPTDEDERDRVREANKSLAKC